MLLGFVEGARKEQEMTSEREGRMPMNANLCVDLEMTKCLDSCSEWMLISSKSKNAIRVLSDQTMFLLVQHSVPTLAYQEDMSTVTHTPLKSPSK